MIAVLSVKEYSCDFRRENVHKASSDIVYDLIKKKIIFHLYPWWDSNPQSPV